MTQTNAVGAAAETVVTRLPRERLDEAATALASAFHEDEGFRHVYPDPRRRARALRPFFRFVLRDALPFGAVDAALAGGRLAGVAVWVPPRAFPPGTARKLRATIGLLPVLLAAPRRFPALVRLGEGLEKAFPSGDQWYLEAIGVAAGAQGSGAGTRLMEHGLGRADRDGLPSYLETVSERNVRWYERLGFRIERSGLDVFGGGPTYWTMRRPPAAPLT